MSWNTSRMAGPVQAPIYGAATTDAQGNTYTPVAGYAPGVVFVIPADQVTPALQAYAAAVPPGVPVLAGVQSVALTFTDETTAKGPLAAFWTPDQ